MTAPACKQPLTAAIVERFRIYHRQHLEWGVFHVALDDGNVKRCIVLDGISSWPVDGTLEERELVAIYNDLTPSQRARLAREA